MSVPTDPLNRLKGFRTRLHSGFVRRADALFELCDTLLTAGAVPSPPHLSLAPAHRRGWVSLYAALSKGLAVQGSRKLISASVNYLGA